MNKSNLQFKIDTASEKQLFLHLHECKDNFNPPLNETVNISEYSKKIVEKAVTIEAWIGDILKGCVAVYFNDKKDYIGYITNVSTTKDCFGLGIASKLMKMCIQYAKQHDFKEIKLQVNKNSSSAINLYKKFSFSNIKNIDDFIEMKLTIDNKE